MRNMDMKRCTSLIKREMQIKPRVRYHLTPIRNAAIKKERKKENNNCWQEYGEIGTLVHNWWDCKVVQTAMENSIGVPQKIKNRTTI